MYEPYVEPQSNAILATMPLNQANSIGKYHHLGHILSTNVVTVVLKYSSETIVSFMHRVSVCTRMHAHVRILKVFLLLLVPLNLKRLLFLLLHQDAVLRFHDLVPHQTLHIER